VPSVSKRQHNLMEAAAHGAKLRSGKGPSLKVAREFVAADKAKGVAYTRKLPEKKSPVGSRAKPKAEY
jgi:hypothetical protein